MNTNNKSLKYLDHRNFLSTVFNVSLFTWLVAMFRSVKHLILYTFQEVSINNISVGEINGFPITISK